MHKEAVAESMGNEMTSKYPYLLRVFPVVLALGYRFSLEELLVDCAEISALHSSHNS